MPLSPNPCSITIVDEAVEPSLGFISIGCGYDAIKDSSLAIGVESRLEPYSADTPRGSKVEDTAARVKYLTNDDDEDDEDEDTDERL